MKFDKKCKPEECVSKDVTRIALNQLYLRNGKLYAADGCVAAIIPVVLEDTDVEGYVSVDAIKHARKADKKVSRKTASLSLECNGEIKLSDGVTFPRESPNNLTYPDVDKVVPDGTKHRFVIALNPEFLLRAAEAIGSEDGVEIHICDGLSPIILRPFDKASEALAVLMPMTLKTPCTAWTEDAPQSEALVRQDQP